MIDQKQELCNFSDAVLREFTKYSAQFDPHYFKQAVELILSAEKNGKRLHISGIGKPHHIAAYMASLFSSVGTPCYLLDGTEATHGSSGQVKDGDVVILISYYGNVQELIKTADTLKANGAILISLTGFDHSYLANIANCHLNVFVEKEGDYHGKAPRTSMLITLYALMSLSLLLQCEKELNDAQYIKWHPNGQLGLPEK